jgi:rhamnose utilization protein RhaD (predicted bifunctional aldolase and dehydrogenase)/NAD(P)-dependent dehydrogenase (short-subunit alcohol dehydrogenase family)
MLRADAPTPSVETILHAVLPYRFVDHTHADAVVTLSNTPEGEAHIRACYGDDVVVVPYVMPGFDLARVVAEQFAREATEKTQGMVLLQHGIFSFAETAEESYARMIELVARAEVYLQSKHAWTLPVAENAAAMPEPVALADLRRQLSDAAGAPMILRQSTDPRGLQFAQQSDAAEIAGRGPVTPDHVIRTKPWPLVLQGERAVAPFVTRYQAYFAEHAPQAKEPKTMLDPAPRVLLDTSWGLLTAGRTVKDAQIVADIYQHTLQCMQRAEQLGGWRALPERDLFDMEYWDLEQAKLRKGGSPPALQGEVVLVTGAASGIGRACVTAYQKAGAAVIALDRDVTVAGLASVSVCALQVDVTDRAAMQAAIARGVAQFGGLDMLVLNAGLFPASKRIADLEDEVWSQVMRVNLDANLALLRMTHPLLKRSPRGGRVVVMGSRNVPAPGPGAAAYSASKAALTQLMRVAALEWAEEGIRINALHPDAVYDTAIWEGGVLEARAAHYGMSVEDYKRRNLLQTEVTSAEVANLAVALCGPLFARTTGAQIPIDGGNERVI